MESVSLCARMYGTTYPSFFKSEGNSGSGGRLDHFLLNILRVQQSVEANVVGFREW